MKKKRIILASRSIARVRMLRSAGLKFSTAPADIDEGAITKSMLAKKKSPKSIARTLSSEKALSISKKNSGALVIGADQVLACDGKILNKARNKIEAAKTIRSLSGKKHILISAVCVAKDGKILWRHIETAHMHARPFDERLLRAYLRRAGPALTRSVGGMELESLGAWMIARAEGDFFTILGMPLLPLLGYLYKEHGIMP